MRPQLARLLLRWILIVNGVVTMLALPAVFLPTQWMDAIHQQLTLGPLPEGAIVQYLARSESAIYTGMGLLTLILAWDLDRFAPIVTWWGGSVLVFGLLLYWIDYTAGMPAFWTWGEGSFLVATGIAALFLQSKAMRRSDDRGHS